MTDTREDIMDHPKDSRCQLCEDWQQDPNRDEREDGPDPEDPRCIKCVEDKELRIHFDHLEARDRARRPPPDPLAFLSKDPDFLGRVARETANLRLAMEEILETVGDLKRDVAALQEAVKALQAGQIERVPF